MTENGASTFEILPAIDLVDGRVVRLRQGDFERVDVYGDDPVAIARGFKSNGARWLHIVDLDGAREGQPRHREVIASVIHAVDPAVRCEVGGGLRSDEAVASVLEAGANRAVVGTAALRDPELAARLVRRHGPDRIAVAIDVRDGVALGDAWRRGSDGPTVRAAIEPLIEAGVVTFEVTAIDRDGVLAGPDLELLASVVELGVEVIASAGIRSVGDLREVRAVGCAGAIVGRALYDGSLDLHEAFAYLDEEEPAPAG